MSAAFLKYLSHSRLPSRKHFQQPHVHKINLSARERSYGTRGCVDNRSQKYLSEGAEKKTVTGEGQIVRRSHFYVSPIKIMFFKPAICNYKTCAKYPHTPNMLAEVIQETNAFLRLADNRKRPVTSLSDRVYKSQSTIKTTHGDRQADRDRQIETRQR